MLKEEIDLWRCVYLVFLFVWAVCGTAGLLWLSTVVWPRSPGISKDGIGEESRGLALIAILGAVGGFVRWIFSTIETGVLEYSLIFLFKSLLSPLLSSALAVIFCIVARAGFFTASKEGNWLGLYALAGMVGLFSPEAVERLASAFSAMFGASGGHLK